MHARVQFSQQRRREDAELLPLVVEQAKTGASIAAQARALGITLTRIQVLRTAAKKAGFEVPQALNTGSRSKSLGIDERTARCECGLLLPCERCLGSAADYVRSGRPSGGDVMGWRHGE